MKKTLIILSIATLIISCKSKQTTTTSAPSTESQVKIQSITINEMVDMKNTGDPYTIQNAKISGDTLILQLSYGGGCETHTFELLNNFAFKENTDSFGRIDNYQTRITLKHDAHNDRCRAIVQEKILFDLTPIRQIGVNEIKMTLLGWENELTYNYLSEKN